MADFLILLAQEPFVLGTQLPVELPGVGDDVLELASGLFPSGTFASDEPVGVLELLGKRGPGDARRDESPLHELRGEILPGSPRCPRASLVPTEFTLEAIRPRQTPT